MIKSAFDMPDIDPKLLPSLLAGGAGALAGGTLTAMSPERQGESRAGRRWRILRNALLLGGAGAGGTALLQKGIQNAVTQPLPANDKEPFVQKIHDLASGKVGIGGAGIGAGLGIANVAKNEEREIGNSLLASIKGKDMQQYSPRTGVENWVADKLKNPGGVAGSQGDNAPMVPLDAIDKYHIHNSGINLPRMERKLDPKLSRLPVFKEDAKLLAHRLTGIGRPGFGALRRTKAVALAAAVPAIISYMSNQDDQ